jgi:spoIIIJ-associated protein
MKKEEIQNLIEDLFAKMTIAVKEINLTKDDEENIHFAIEISDPYHFLNHNAEGLSALNHLVRRILENKYPPEIDKKNKNILVDINNFQKKKIENVQAIAHMMAERARYFKSNIEVDPMTAFERRLVHEFLANASDLKTESTGEGYSRRVVIKYIGNII